MNVMSMPTSKLCIVAAMAFSMVACGKNDKADFEMAEKSASKEAAIDGKIECALAGSTTFDRVCTTDRISGPEGQILVIRHPDGGFRRFNILTDGRGLSPAQGFDETKISILANGMIELKSGDDLYHLPAQIKAKDKAEAAPAEAGTPKAG
jgi:hypothetical protein